MLVSVLFTEMKSNKMSLQELPADVADSEDGAGTDINVI